MAKPSPSHAGEQTLVKIGKAVRHIRKLRSVSQEQLALIADLDRSYVGGIERGEHNLTIMSLVKLAEALEVRLTDLIRD
jgi:transcriptional regulator with XRE-family HTH domain